MRLPFSIVLLLSSFVLPASAFAGFSDVPASHQNYDAVVYVQEEGIISGYPNGTYKPDNRINRAEFTKIVIGALADKKDIDACPGLESIYYRPFSDVPKNVWYDKYVCQARNTGVVGGYPNGTFGPDKEINFAEAATVLFRAFYENQYFAKFSVDPSLATVSDDVWYEKSVRQLGIANAIPFSITDYWQSITRGEMAEMIYRLKAGVTTKPSQNFDTLASSAYNDPQHLYSISYPSTWSVSPNDAGVTLEAHAGTVQKFVRSSLIRIRTEEQCPVVEPSPGTIVQTVQLGGHAFTAVETMDGAAGTLYDEITFTSLISPSKCLVLIKTIAMSNALIENEQDRQESKRQETAMQEMMKNVLLSISINAD